MTQPQGPLSDRLEAAAAALTRSHVDPEATALLRYLGYDDPDPGAAPARARMLRAAAQFRRLFRLPVPDAPGLVFFGAEADPAGPGAGLAPMGPEPAPAPVGFAGSGLDPRHAFESCVGEGIEYLSQFAQPGDQLQSATIEAVAKALDPDTYDFVEAAVSAAHRPIDWVPVRRLMDGEAFWYPADLCLRRAAPDFVPPLKLSTGCAAGPTREAATLHALLELIERDALALWWRGGRRPRRIDPAGEAGSAGTALLAQLRQTRDQRETSLLDITTGLGIPVVAAFSTSRNGHGFALGLAARTTLAEATRAAIFELCQSELSLHVIAAKHREGGEAALNDSDRHQRARADLLHPDTCKLLRPGNDPPLAPPQLTADPVEAIVRLLAKQGIVSYTFDLTRPRFDVPVVRVIAPGLQPEPCKIVTRRLAQVIAETGGGNNQIALL